MYGSRIVFHLRVNSLFVMRAYTCLCVVRISTLPTCKWTRINDTKLFVERSLSSSNSTYRGYKRKAFKEKFSHLHCNAIYNFDRTNVPYFLT